MYKSKSTKYINQLRSSCQGLFWADGTVFRLAMTLSSRPQLQCWSEAQCQIHHAKDASSLTNSNNTLITTTTTINNSRINNNK